MTNEKLMMKMQLIFSASFVSTFSQSVNWRSFNFLVLLMSTQSCCRVICAQGRFFHGLENILIVFCSAMMIYGEALPVGVLQIGQDSQISKNCPNIFCFVFWRNHFTTLK